jgi:hypothetical protein
MSNALKGVILNSVQTMTIRTVFFTPGLTMFQTEFSITAALTLIKRMRERRRLTDAMLRPLSSEGGSSWLRNVFLVL